MPHAPANASQSGSSSRRSKLKIVTVKQSDLKIVTVNRDELESGCALSHRLNFEELTSKSVLFSHQLPKSSSNRQGKSLAITTEIELIGDIPLSAESSAKASCNLSRAHTRSCPVLREACLIVQGLPSLSLLQCHLRPSSHSLLTSIEYQDCR